MCIIRLHYIYICNIYTYIHTYKNYIHIHIYTNAVVVCDELQAPSNGIVRVSGSTEGSTATYSCISGDSLVGNSQRQCQSNGEWSGTQPFCERNSKITFYV